MATSVRAIFALGLVLLAQISTSSAALTLTLDKESYAIKEFISVTYADFVSDPTATHWLQIAAPGACTNSSSCGLPVQVRITSPDATGLVPLELGSVASLDPTQSWLVRCLLESSGNYSVIAESGLFNVTGRGSSTKPLHFSTTTLHWVTAVSASVPWVEPFGFLISPTLGPEFDGKQEVRVALFASSAVDARELVPTYSFIANSSQTEISIPPLLAGPLGPCEWRVLLTTLGGNVITISRGDATITGSVSLSLGKATFPLGADIVVNWTAPAGHSSYDLITIRTADTKSGVASHYINSLAASGSVTFDAFEAAQGEVFEVLYYLDDATNAAVAGYANFTYQADVAVQLPALLTFGKPFPIQFTSNVEGEEGYDTIIGRFSDCEADGTGPAGCDQILTATAVVGHSGFILASPVSKDALSNRTEPYTVNFWYQTRSGETLSTGANATFVDAIGTCDSSCSNAGTQCTAHASCTACQSATTGCVSSHVPQWTETSIAHNARVSIFPGATSSFVIQVNPNGASALELSASTRHPDLIQVVKNPSGAVTSWTVTISTDVDHHNLNWDYCYVVTNENSVAASETRCVEIYVKGTACYAWGDPHLSTFDNTFYDFHGFGDFYLINQADLSIQTRFTPCPGTTSFTCASALAVKVDGFRASIYLTGTSGVKQVLIRKNNENSTFVASAEDSTVDFVAGQIRYRPENDKVTLALRSGVYIELADISTDFPRVMVKLPKDTLYHSGGGLCGSWDSNPNNDLAFANGTIVHPSTASPATIFDFVRVPWFNSAFDYAQDSFDYNTVNQLTFTPAFQLAWSSQQLKNAATGLCGDLVGLSMRDGCMLDISVTNSLTGAASAVGRYLSSCGESSNPSLCKINAACSSNNYCSYKGVCVSGNCHCADGWSGSDCSVATAPTAPIFNASQALSAPWVAIVSLVCVIALALHL